MFTKSSATKTLLFLLIALFSFSSVSYGIMLNYGESNSLPRGDQILTILQQGKKIEEITYSKVQGNFSSKDKLLSIKNYQDLLTAFNQMGIIMNANFSGEMGNQGLFLTKDIAMENSAPMSTGSSNVSSADMSESTKKDYSSTNSQVKGIDEADVLKTDGRYIYYISNNFMHIVDTQNSTKKICTLNLSSPEDMSYRDLYIVKDKMILIGTRSNMSIMPLSVEDTTMKKSIAPSIYPYPMGKNYTTFTIYDITDKTNPREERVIEVEGDSISTRLMGNTVYFITNKWINPIPWGKVEATEILPTYKDTKTSKELLTVPAKDIYYFPDSRDTQYMLVGAFDVTKDENCTPQAYLGSGETIYMSQNSLYVVKPNYRDYTSMQTDIFRFAVKGTTLNFSGSCTVNGHVLNQYSMDEYGGYFRIATGDSTGGNGITVIDINSMFPVGKIQGLAVGEEIYSVRFMGDMAYMVTFRQVDPLFIIDLSNPKSPIKTAELKIPGFSQYLHPMGDKYLIGFGRHTEEFFVEDGKGGFTSSGQVRDAGFKLSLFDISDKKNPKELFVKVYRNTWSEASHNPRSIMVDSEKGIFAFPMENNANAFSGGTVVKVDANNGFTTMADIYGGSYGYNNRFCYIGQKLYFFTKNDVTVLDYTNYKVLEKIFL